MATKPETRLTNAIRAAVQRAWPGCWLMKVHGSPMQSAGIPDLVGVIDGRFVALEVKLPDGSHRLTPLQAATIGRIRQAGGIAFEVDSVEQAIALLDEQLRTTDRTRSTN